MSNESKKDFNAMMNNNKDMPKTEIVKDEKIIKKYGGTKMFFAPPIYYDELMKKRKWYLYFRNITEDGEVLYG